MSEPADLEIMLRRRDSERYSVELRGTLPGSDAEVRPLRDQGLTITFDTKRLRELENNPAAYGQALGEMLFANPSLTVEIGKARAVAQSLEAPLRLRIAIASDAAELHALRWETLRDPHEPNISLLTTGEQIFFSRYLASANWQPVRLRAQGELRALVAVANPADLAAYGLSAIDLPREVQIARDGLRSINTTVLGGEARVTLETLISSLREGYDIVYLMAHAQLRQDDSYIFLEDEYGHVKVVPGRELSTQIDQLAQRPRLVVLAACQSAGDMTANALTALGPQLAVAGIPAVLAMQGVVSVETVELLLPAFFNALQRDGQIDRALAIARNQVRARPDFWMPVLFMRLTSGRIWYTPGFTEGTHGPADSKWEPLTRHLRNLKCTPILGPDLVESLAGARRDIARKLAEDFHFPLAPHDREGMPQVAQFLAVDQGAEFMQDKVAEYLCEAIRRQHMDELPPDLQALDLRRAMSADLRSALAALLRHACAAAQQHGGPEPYQVLAQLPIPIYLTADPSDLLVEALSAANKHPQVMFCPWNDYTRDLPSPFTENMDYDPTQEQPLVFRLFGGYQEPESLVLTEDNHFDYLIGVTRNKDLIPKVVRSRLADTALLFLGFRPEDWAFRVFFRILMGQEGSRRRTNYAHVAVQVAPEEGRTLEPQRARQYLETYFADFFSELTKISVYWGNAEDFIRELHQRW